MGLGLAIRWLKDIGKYSQKLERRSHIIETVAQAALKAHSVLDSKAKNRFR